MTLSLLELLFEAKDTTDHYWVDAKTNVRMRECCSGMFHHEMIQPMQEFLKSLHMSLGSLTTTCNFVAVLGVRIIKPTF